MNATPTPWYKVGMVWLVIILPLIVVVAALSTVVIAHQHAPTVIQSEAH